MIVFKKKKHCYICNSTKEVANITIVYSYGMKDVVIPLCIECCNRHIHIAQQEREDVKNDRKTDYKKMVQ